MSDEKAKENEISEKLNSDILSINRAFDNESLNMRVRDQALKDANVRYREALKELENEHWFYK
ncbi:MAG: hypothetical protein WCL21_19395 [Mariniphaga sp.]